MLHRLRLTWEKNWPEVRCAATRSVPDFVLSRDPQPGTDSVPVFCYHDVAGPELRTDLEYLRRNSYATLIADELIAFLRGEFALKGPSVVLTFDDCSRSLYETALPLLESFSSRAVAFASPGYHDLAETARESHQRPCTWAELTSLERSGVVDIQSHSLEHRYFPRWPEPVPLCGAEPWMNERIARNKSRNMAVDVRMSREILEKNLDKSVRHLAFPKYDGTEEAVMVGQEVGYSSFWWGVLPGRPNNFQSETAALCIVRISGEFLRRLPGEGRATLKSIMGARYGRSCRRWMRLMGQHLRYG